MLSTAEGNKCRYLASIFYYSPGLEASAALLCHLTQTAESQNFCTDILCTVDFVFISF